MCTVVRCTTAQLSNPSYSVSYSPWFSQAWAPHNFKICVSFTIFIVKTQRRFLVTFFILTTFKWIYESGA